MYVIKTVDRRMEESTPAKAQNIRSEENHG